MLFLPSKRLKGFSYNDIRLLLLKLTLNTNQ